MAEHTGSELVRKAWDDRLLQTPSTVSVSGARVLTAYNAVIDYIEYVQPPAIEELLKATGRQSEILLRSTFEPTAIRTPEEFLAALLHAFREGKALHIITESSTLLDWLDSAFKGPDKRRMGGQAGIMANQLAALGANTTVYTPLLSPRQAAVFYKGIQTPVLQKGRLALVPVAKAARKTDGTKINWIFEFKHGDKISVGGQLLIAPRANRFILASPAKALHQFDSALQKVLPALGMKVDKAIFSGYQHLEPVWAGVRADKVLEQEVKNLRALRSKNKKLRFHAEFVPSKHPELERKMWTALFQEIKSLGCNEVELQQLLNHFKFSTQLKTIQKVETAFTIYKGAQKLLQHLKLDRVHVHNLGYFVTVLRKDYPVPLEKVRDAALYASAVAQAKALSGSPVVLKSEVPKGAAIQVSETGLNQVRGFAGELARELPKALFDQKRFTFEGTAQLKDHSVVVVPGQIVLRPKVTVGLGDIISAVSFIAEG